MKAYIGVDVGNNGAACLITESKHIDILRFNKATPKDIFEWFNRCAFDYECMCTIEAVHAMPGEGVSSAFTFGLNIGMIEGFVISTYIPYEKKTPQTWMKMYGIKREIVRENGKEVKEKSESKTDFKRRLRQKAEQLYPSVSMTNDVADAILIAHFCFTQHHTSE